jgi:hypothetical protein
LLIYSNFGYEWRRKGILCECQRAAEEATKRENVPKEICGKFDTHIVFFALRMCLSIFQILKEKTEENSCVCRIIPCLNWNAETLKMEATSCFEMLVIIHQMT